MRVLGAETENEARKQVRKCFGAIEQVSSLQNEPNAASLPSLLMSLEERRVKVSEMKARSFQYFVP